MSITWTNASSFTIPVHCVEVPVLECSISITAPSRYFSGDGKDGKYTLSPLPPPAFCYTAIHGQFFYLVPSPSSILVSLSSVSLTMDLVDVLA
jgi:hypothetical protein